MRKTLIAIAIAGSLAAGAAGAQGAFPNTVHRQAGAEPVRVQYYANDPRRVQYGDVPSSPVIDDREARLAQRIERGLESGRLTRREAWRMRRQLEDVQARERAYMADGRLARWEERELMRELDRVAYGLRAQLRDEDRAY